MIYIHTYHFELVPHVRGLKTTYLTNKPIFYMKITSLSVCLSSKSARSSRGAVRSSMSNVRKNTGHLPVEQRVQSFLRANRPSRSGFTLVEMMMCVGIIATTFFPLLGMMLVGVNVARESIDITVTDQIVQQLTGEAQQTDFSQLDTLETTYSGTAPGPKSGRPFLF